MEMKEIAKLSSHLKLYNAYSYPNVWAVVCAKSGHEVKDLLMQEIPTINSNTINMTIIGIARKEVKKGIIIIREDT